ncbi:hypothetical protein [Mycobacterium avium]|uniref:hypothetical protein n=1 Tax=Mycobacterium avium TaxID=1764 RepID=UPI000CE3A6A7|nr:hypothetical protein [Mycobacterium avium]
MNELVINALLDTLAASEVILITTTLQLRVRELERRRDDSRRYAAELTQPDRQRFYQEFADEDEREIASLTALLAKLT